MRRPEPVVVNLTLAPAMVAAWRVVFETAQSTPVRVVFGEKTVFDIRLGAR